MGTRYFDDYSEPPVSLWYNGTWVEGSADASLANACVANYSETRRNVCNYTANTSGVVALSSASSGRLRISGSRPATRCASTSATR